MEKINKFASKAAQLHGDFVLTVSAGRFSVDFSPISGIVTARNVSQVKDLAVAGYEWGWEKAWGNPVPAESEG